jgi:stress response protein SCP2
MASAHGGGDDLTVYVGDAGEKYSDLDDWRDLIMEGRLLPGSTVPIRRAGALSHQAAKDVPELKVLFDQHRPEPIATSPAPAEAKPPSAPAAAKVTPERTNPVQPPAQLQQGANAAVPGDDVLGISLSWTPPSPAYEVDVSAYLLGPAGRVRSDDDMVFFNQPSAEGDAIELHIEAATAGRSSLDVTARALPESVARIVVCLSITDALERGQTFAQLSPITIGVGPRGRPPVLAYTLEREAGREAAMILGELYRRQGAWRFRAVGQGFAGGLAPLARSFGVDVEA